MAYTQVFYFALALFSSFSLAISLSAPRATGVTGEGHPTLAFSPATTQAPSFQDLRRHIKRQLEPRQALTQTCGYIEGLLEGAITCGSGQACGYNTADSYFGCCPVDSSGEFITSECPQVNNPYTSCVPYTDAAYCTGACYNYNRVCDEDMPFCGVDLLVDDFSTYTAYFCNSVLADAVLTVYTDWTATSAGTASSSLNSFTEPINVAQTTVPNTSPGAAGSTSPSSPITTAPQSSPVDVKKTGHHTGAIAGGVVGGLVGLAAIIGAAVFFLRRKKKAELRQSRMEISQAPQ